MREEKTIIRCDKCGSEIKGNPINMIVAEIDRDTREIVGTGKYANWEKCDFCPACIDGFLQATIKAQVKRIAVSPGKKRNKAAVTKPVTIAKTGITIMPDNTYAVTSASEKNIDSGKIMALCQAGWKPSDIAADMKISEQAVMNCIQRSMSRIE